MIILYIAIAVNLVAMGLAIVALAMIIRERLSNKHNNEGSKK